MVSNQPVNPNQTVVSKLPCFLYKIAVAQDKEAYTMQVFPHLAIQTLHYSERHMTVLQYLTQLWQLHSPDSVACCRNPGFAKIWHQPSGRVEPASHVALVAGYISLVLQSLLNATIWASCSVAQMTLFNNAQDEEAYTMQVFPQLAIQTLHYSERHMTVLQYLTQLWRLHSPDSVASCRNPGFPKIWHQPSGRVEPASHVALVAGYISLVLQSLLKATIWASCSVAQMTLFNNAQDEEAYTMQVFPHLAIVAIQRLHYSERHMTLLQYLTQLWRLHNPDSVACCRNPGFAKIWHQPSGRVEPASHIALVAGYISLVLQSLLKATIWASCSVAQMTLFNNGLYHWCSYVTKFIIFDRVTLFSSRCPLVIMNQTASSNFVHFLINSSPGGSYQEPMLSESGGWWKQFNVNHDSRQGGNFTDSPVNRTLMLPADDFDPLGGHTMWQVIIIVFLTGSLSLVTVVGNILVLVSFKINKALKTVNNYYLLSLAFADLIIGTLSMNLYTTYFIMNQWALGPVVCDLWLAIDYVASNASVMNLLVISFDRYFSVTRPLTYRTKRTTKRAMTMIGLAWSISFILWAPAILFWQYIEGRRTVPSDQCYIQFLTEPIITFCTAIAAFYLPVTIMAILFWKIYQETEKRAKDVQGLKGSGSGNSNSQTHNQGSASGRACEAVTINQRDSPAILSSQSCSSYELNQLASEKNKDNAGIPGGKASRGKCGTFCFQFSTLLPGHHASKRSVNTTTTTLGEAKKSSSDSFNDNEAGAPGNQAGLLEKADHATPPKPPTGGKKSTKKIRDKQQSSSIRSPEGSQSNPVTSLRANQSPPTFTMKDAAMAKRFASKAKTEINKRANEKKANEKKAARTLSAILFAFVMTWLPYNIMVLVNTFCQVCIPETLWALGYWLCYVNSTVNPMCYALCNKTFRTTFKDILMCQWNHRKRKTHFHQGKAVTFRKKDPV
ncbi:Muscarinic acetylcholine receptor M3 [Collichthys lucidus]|uniref:Muscarinic acetylcholine receptor n=1 Tax=Collichthys lucidus TaxID=240159 RepID=A0A4U5TWM9_COLLU|nr:Muscarinic acetylcholine receptor M3 [Collichthys lucidus]